MTVQEIMCKATAEIGVTEFPANSNNVKYNTWFYGREVSGDNYPWCMVFVQWCFDGRLPFKTASCSSLLQWYKKNKPEAVVDEPEMGDIVIYNFGHTGIVESYNGNTVTAIEGNTAIGSESNGGAVMKRTRSVKTIEAFIRPEYTKEISKKEEENMTGEEIYKKLTEYLRCQGIPSWAVEEFSEAVDMGITDGTNPMELVPRYQAAIMARRAVKKNA
jgi:hypothetical protein